MFIIYTAYIKCTLQKANLQQINYNSNLSDKDFNIYQLDWMYDVHAISEQVFNSVIIFQLL